VCECAWQQRVRPLTQDLPPYIRLETPCLKNSFAKRPTIGCIVVQAYLFTQACSFLELFCHNFAENGPQDLKMVQKDASRNSTQSVIKISS
jgi:hypothetical protein